MKRKHNRIGVPVVLGGVLGLLATGCSGINTSHSVSPASFFLPGLMQADPPPATDQPAAPTAEPVLVAQSR